MRTGAHREGGRGAPVRYDAAPHRRARAFHRGVRAPRRDALRAESVRARDRAPRRLAFPANAGVAHIARRPDPSRPHRRALRPGEHDAE